MYVFAGNTRSDFETSYNLLPTVDKVVTFY